MTILGIDPGTTRLGYAVVGGTRQHPVLLESGVIGNVRLAPAARLKAIYTELTLILSSAKPDAVAVEKVFFSKNTKTAMSIAEARGVILLTAAMAGHRVYEYAPQEIKIALTGIGNAGKAQVAGMVSALLHLTKPTYWDDESDAMAIAITGLVLEHDTNYKRSSV
ncbi:MAG: crossover junction endodeoxyribonuclease RuvC [Candidatus Sungbacteria bacterium RIFCSPHIGHO2_02_FULL_49_12]|uniref:Crossover junction endodeoxyribonuclease RuvC n=1 Tax=Candidatus Sungbacteria bacterium RIFCSPHIGHO2_02_FULL_49_12 TaxID=1802271 RepID=A0A1G2KSR3_9BACT|nr:MAG: crossover junction endodeoxyribonuclease RuvC [Candidatus Sungbacteria bacterium RIFCSPHIGHO2_02_FULL_49_12]